MFYITQIKVLKNFFTGTPLREIQFFNSSAVGRFSTMWRASNFTFFFFEKFFCTLAGGAFRVFNKQIFRHGNDAK